MKIKDILLMAVATTAILTGCNNKESKVETTEFVDDVKVGIQSKGVGQAIWKAIESLHPETEVWETCTPYFDRRNIHFYINSLGFHAVEFFNEHHPDPHMPELFDQEDGLFRFEKRMAD